jgi:hypothetical protein
MRGSAVLMSLALGAGFGAVGNDATAQTSALARTLRAATRVDCRFTALATGDWDGAAAKAAVTEVDHSAAFFDIDVDGGTAEAEGAYGATFIVVRYANGYLHFMQMSDGGPLYLTTVLAQPSADGRFKAMQTRHEYSRTMLPGFTSRPEMYVGDCEVTSG